MEFECVLCQYEQQRSDEAFQASECVNCGAQHNWNEGFMLSSTWAAEEIKRLRIDQKYAVTGKKLLQAIQGMCEPEVREGDPVDGYIRVYLRQQFELERLQGILLKLRGGIADLQRHVKARSEDDPPMFIPASMCAIIGAMREAAEAKEG